jgi:hypothetical protein
MSEPVSGAKFPASWENTGILFRRVSECCYWLEIWQAFQ